MVMVSNGTERRKLKGFTLIEIMIVVSIIGILAVIAVPNFLSYQKRAMGTEDRSQLRHILTLQHTYYHINLTYGNLDSIHWLGITGSHRYIYRLSYG